MRLPLLLLLAGLLPAALVGCLDTSEPPPEDGAQRPREVMRVGEDGRMYQVRIDGARVLFEDFGPAQRELRLGDGLAPPPTRVDTFQLPLRDMEAMFTRVSTYEAPTDQVGVGMDGGELWLAFQRSVSIWGAVAAGLGLVGAGGLAVGVVLTRRERRRRAAEALARQRALHAREAERTRIARELHDGPLQDIHALRLLGVAGGDEGVGEEAGRIARELRAIAEGLRPPALGRFGLAAALSAHANRVKDRHPGVVIALDLDEDGTGSQALPDVVRAALFRIAQEAVTNAIEHGGAGRVQIMLALPAPSDDDGAVVLEVADDGAGLAGPPPDLAALADAGHFGLVGMHERADAIGGRLLIGPGGIGGRGTRVRAHVPAPRAVGAAPLPRRLAGSARWLRAHLLPS